MPATATYGATGTIYIDAVLSGVKWAVSSLTFSFPTDPAFYGSAYGYGEPNNSFQAFNSQQQIAARAVLQNYSSVINVTFTQVTETSTQHGDLRFAKSGSPGTAWSYYPSTSPSGGDAWFNSSSNSYDNPQKGNYAWLTMLHEFGHAMGLKHPHEISGVFGQMPTARDSLEYSVMSYHSYVGATQPYYTNDNWSYPQSLMMYDIAALQRLYGANYTTNAGNTVYSWDANTGKMYLNGTEQSAPGGNRVFLTIWDGGGNDTYDFSNYSTSLNVNLEPGSWSRTSTTQLANLGDGHVAAGNIANALLYQNNPASLIENAIGGSGNDTIVGNVADNEFTGGRGNDFLDGAAGTNTARFSGSASDYSVTQNADGSWTVADLRAGAPDGTDTLKNIQYLNFSNSTLALDNAPPIAAGKVLTGNSAANILIGGGGSDTLDGRSGADKMYGGFGNDFYVIDNSGDIADETGGDGSDTILSSISFSLADPVHAIGAIENLTLIGTSNINATGNALNNELTGNGGANVLIGGAGADRLEGGGGTDTASYAASAAGVAVSLMTGIGSGGDAAGDQLLHIENLTGSNFDDTLEGAAGNNRLAGGLGIDTVSYAHASSGTNGQGVTVNLALTKAQNTIRAGTDTLSGFENLIGSQFNDTLTGTSGNNVLTGLAGNDQLNGGAGADQMYGGTGNDTYTIDNVGDVANETDGDGTDTIRSSISFSLGDPVHAIGAIENLTLTGSSAIDATGNNLDNVLTGNSAANVLSGGGGSDTLNGGTGADKMYGGSGNDTYVIDHSGDVVDETGGGGTDTILSSISFSLTEPVHAIGSIENLTLTGSGDRNATGNELDNVLIGNSGANVLIGGAGIDTLDGGGGIDTASYVTSASGVVVSLATGIGSGGDAEGDHLSNIERLIGSNLDDTLEGNAGNNKLMGGAGIDTVSYAHSTSGANSQGVTANLSLTSAQNTVTAGSDTLSGFENLTGSQFNDTLKGNAGNNVISGLSGNDKLTGAGGNDTFVFLPGFGKDTITDFTAGPNSGPHDLIAFDHTVFADFDAVMAASTQVVASTVITFHENTVTLANVSLGSLHHDDFAFV